MKLVISIPKNTCIFDVNEDNTAHRADPLDQGQRKELVVNFCLSLVEHLSANGVFSLNNLDEESGEFSLTFKGGKVQLSWMKDRPIYGTLELGSPTEEFKEWFIDSLKHFGARYSTIYEVTEDVLV
jgi:hypothetical protein